MILPSRIASGAILCQPRACMAFESFIDFVARLGSGGELKRLSQPAATVNELKEERAMVADLLPK